MVYSYSASHPPSAGPAQSQNPAMSNLGEFYQHCNSLDTSLAGYYHQIPVGWFKQLFPTSQFAFCFANNELGIWVKLSIRLFSHYTTGVLVYTCRRLGGCAMLCKEG